MKLIEVHRSDFFCDNKSDIGEEIRPTEIQSIRIRKNNWVSGSFLIQEKERYYYGIKITEMDALRVLIKVSGRSTL